MGHSSGLEGCGKCRPQRELFSYSLVLCVHFILTCFFLLIVLYFAFLSLLTTNNTNIHVSGGIRTRYCSKRLAAGTHLILLGNWDRQGFDPRSVQPIAGRCTDPQCDIVLCKVRTVPCLVQDFRWSRLASRGTWFTYILTAANEEQKSFLWSFRQLEDALAIPWLSIVSFNGRKLAVNVFSCGQHRRPIKYWTLCYTTFRKLRAI